MANFSDLGLSNHYTKALKELDIHTPTEVQQRAIPFLLKQGTDFVGLAHTGTGKTAAFGLPILEKIDPNQNKIQAIIMAPTRELCQQIKQQLFKFTKYTPEKIFSEAIYGGELIERQIKRLKRPTHLLVATPGRLLEMTQKRIVDLRHVQNIVLDEADEMLRMGFKEDIDKILSEAPRQQKTWLFSATMPDEIRKIIARFMDNAEHLQVTGKSRQLMNDSIKHQFVLCHAEQKFTALFEFIRSQGAEKGVIFCRTKSETQKLSDQLNERKIKSGAMHGDLTQKERDKVMRAFKGDKLKLLVCTDIAARGIDIKNLAFVVHFQLPDKLEYFTHRSGRTGRAGKSGLSLCIVNDKEVMPMKEIEKKLKIKIQRVK